MILDFGMLRKIIDSFFVLAVNRKKRLSSAQYSVKNKKYLSPLLSPKTLRVKRKIIAEEKMTERKNIIITIIKAFKKQFSERGK